MVKNKFTFLFPHHSLGYLQFIFCANVAEVAWSQSKRFLLVVYSWQLAAFLLAANCQLVLASPG